MADSKNYKVNLVTDVQDLVKGNNELRATSRYIDSVKRAAEQFGRARYQSLIKVNTELKYMERHLGNIYSLAVRVGRLRVTPTVYLIDQATPALERLLKKLKEVSSYAVVAKANIHFKMQAIPAAATVMTKVDTTTTTTITGLNMDGWITALNTNTAAINDLSSKIGSAGGSSTSKPKGLLDYIIGTATGLKDLGGGIKAAGETVESSKKLRDAWKSTPTTKAGKILKWGTIIKEGGNILGQSGTFFSGILGGSKGIVENISGGFKSLLGTDNASAAPSASTSSASSTSRVIAEGSEGAGKALKGFSKFLGPLGYAFDAINFATAENNEQRGAAIGSAAGGAIGVALGGVLGSVVPVLGNVVLGAGLGVGGSLLGDKVGGMIGQLFDSPSVPLDKTVTESLKYGNTMPPIDFSHVTGFPEGPPKIPSMMLAPRPSFADRYIVPNVENYMKPKVEAMAQQNANKVTPSTTITTTTKTSVQSVVQLSDAQMGTISGMLKDFKTELTNNIAVNVPAGAVQVTVKENKIDYDLLANQVGQRIMVEVRKALENQKPPAQAAQ
ncbi:hypothetical protein [Paenibacillus hunanensis]|uniref:Tail tape measure protein n=1 Tax=Paenibacillus hunanensis TaxID=539262 RepID=A0ABU1IVQ1_9BACL|nr:hypothetical protein [Paenibacillus hunanensis]MDR6243347.1 hypothetical protein [Paenibacillus hunanensis]GGI97086.1 hypothetical protein GCM10008022_02120 [Paenibacillus hunanensis]